jgi:hypothetical protein
MKMDTFSYRRAAQSVKFVVSGFLLFALIGLGVAALQIYVKTGLTTHGALIHYRGDEAALQIAMSFGELVEITHAHAFTMPLLVLGLGSAFVFTETSEQVKRLVVIALLASIALELGLPWLVRYGPSWTVHGFTIAGLLLGGSLFVAVAVPLYEMWLAR